MEEIGDIRARLQALPEPAVDQTATRLSQAAKQQTLNTRELEQIGEAQTRLHRLRQVLLASTEAHLQEETSTAVVDESLNHVLSEKVEILFLKHIKIFPQ